MKPLTSLSLVTTILALVTHSIGVAQVPARVQPLPFSCLTFPQHVSAADLMTRFGAAHVHTSPVPWGGAEGDVNEGTVLFDKDPTARLEIFWHDTASKRGPAWVSVRGERSRWRTPAGISLGTDLKTIEKLNAGPIRLLGFGTDVSGTVLSWAAPGGRLAAQDTSECRVRVRLRVPPERRETGPSMPYRLVIGEREFSSGHPAMQSLNPSVYELFLQYR